MEPLHDAVNVEAVRACTPHQGAVIARQLAIWTAAIEGHSANAAVVVVRYPAPGRNPRPTYAKYYL